MGFEISAPLFHDFLRLNARWYPDKCAIVCPDENLSWKVLNERANQVANGLRAAGAGRGSSIAILMDNTASFVEVLFGVLKAGSVAVPLNLTVSEAGLAGMIADSECRIAFMSADQAVRMKGAIPAGEGMTVLVSGGSVEPFQSYAAWRSRYPDTEPNVQINDEDPCNIIYSSGTTAQPKGIKHLYRRRVQSMYELALAHRYHFEAVSICPIGLYSNIAWASLFCTLITGGTCVIRNRFDPEDWLHCVETYGVTHTFMVPVQFRRILDAPGFDPDRVKSLEAVISGGAPLFAELKGRVMDAFPCAVIELYGLTEGFMTTLQPGESADRMTSVGKPVRGNDYIIIDPEGHVLGWGHSGEICVRSVHWMSEYHNRPEATEEIRFVDHAGQLWMRTGDIGRTDEQGYLYIVDRLKDMILSGGQNVFPADIEAVLIGHPLIDDVAVIALPDTEWGEVPMALVVCQPGAALVASETIAWANRQLGSRQRIRELLFVEDLPRNPNGKVLKRLLRERYLKKKGPSH